MIQYNSKDAYLAMPKGLGNLGGNSGGGSGTDVTPLSGSVVELSAATVTVASNLDALSGTTGNIASSIGSVNTNLEALSGSVETLSSEVDSMGDSVADLLLDITGLEDQTTANTAHIATLSGSVDTLSSSTVTGLETAQNTANSANTLADSAYTLADSAYTLANSLTGDTGGGKTFVIYDVYAQNTELADFLFEYADTENRSETISSGYPSDTRILLWLGQDFQGAFNPYSKGFAELYPESVQYDEDTVIVLTGVFSDREAEAYSVRVKYTAEGYTSGNWVERIRQDIYIYRPTYVRFGNNERGWLTYDADNDRFEYDGGYITPGDTSTTYPDLIDKLFTDYLIDGGEIWTGAEYLYALNYNKLYVRSNGETRVYAHPALVWREINETVDGVTFTKEITYKYADWEMTAYYGGNDSNIVANLRISAV